MLHGSFLLGTPDKIASKERFIVYMNIQACNNHELLKQNLIAQQVSKEIYHKDKNISTRNYFT